MEHLPSIPIGASPPPATRAKVIRPGQRYDTYESWFLEYGIPYTPGATAPEKDEEVEVLFVAPHSNESPTSKVYAVKTKAGVYHAFTPEGLEFL